MWPLHQELLIIWAFLRMSSFPNHQEWWLNPLHRNKLHKDTDAPTWIYCSHINLGTCDDRSHLHIRMMLHSLWTLALWARQLGFLATRGTAFSAWPLWQTKSKVTCSRSYIYTSNLNNTAWWLLSCVLISRWSYYTPPMADAPQLSLVSIFISTWGKTSKWREGQRLCPSTLVQFIDWQRAKANTYPPA